MKPKRLLTIMLIAISVFQIIWYNSNVSAEPSSQDPEVKSVLHTVELLEGGLIIVNDTVTVSNFQEISSFKIGFPYDYAEYLVKCFAAANNERIPVTPDYGLGIPGFYGILLNPTSETFTVTFIFSGPITVKENSITLNFTLFPSLTVNAEICNTTVIIPENLNFLEASFEYNQTETKGEKEYYYLNPVPLEKFAYNKAKAWLRLQAKDDFVYAEIEKLDREIEIDMHGNINVKDIYLLVNKGANSIEEIPIFFPKEGYKNSFRIESAAGVSKITEDNLKSNRLPIPSLEPGEKSVFSVIYKLNSSMVLSDGKFNVSVGKVTPLLIRKLTVSFVAFQGVNFEVSDEIFSLASNIKREFSRDSVTFTLYDFTVFDWFQTTIKYKVNILWASYPYTLLTLASTAIILLGIYIWRKPAPAPVAAPKIVVSPRIFRKFVEGYEERIEIISRLSRLEEQARRGRIPRRQYKVRKTMLENRLSSLSKELAELRETIRRSGPRYADIIRQLEIAEAQLEEAEAGIRRVRSRYRRGEISREAYRRLLEEHEKRIEDANLKIEGALLRLREEYS